MSSSNGTAGGHPTQLDFLERITRPAVAAGYVPNVYVGSRLGMILDGRPRFTWLEAERMRWDPQVQLGLRILRTPLYGVTWRVHADDPAVGRWVDRELSRVYRRMLPRLVRCFEYGVACGEVTYSARKRRGKTRVHFGDFHELHPRDVRPMVYERGPRAGKMAGVHVQMVSGVGAVYLDRMHSFWFKGETEYGDWWGRPRLAGAYEPWLEKRGRHGAVDSRRLFYKKCAFRGPRLRYPVGRTDMGTPGAPDLRSNQDIARELVEKFENGGVLAMPNIPLPDGGGQQWAWEDPQAFPDVAGLLDYPKQLDKEIMIGLGIPPELVEASTVGSGYSGRAIPAQMFFGSMDEMATIIVEALDKHIIRSLVRLNFGKAGYEIELDSLAELVGRAPPDDKPAAAQPPVRLSRRWNEAQHPRETTAHDGKRPGEFAPAADTPAAPDTASLANAVSERTLHPGVSVRRDASGQPWVVKGRAGRGHHAANEAVAAGLAGIAGADVVPVHHVQLNGQDHLVVPHVEGTDLSRLTPSDRRAALAKISRSEIDAHVLFDYAIGSADPNHGNYLLTDGGTRLRAIDKEQSLSRGMGKKTIATIPYFLGDVVPEGQAADTHEFDRQRVAHAAAAAEKMAAHLEGQRRTADAAGVRARAAVLRQLATGQAAPTAGELMRLGHAADAQARANRGILGRLFGGR